jgi:zinc/manganese transport system substrate-binding protein/manganese/iron transport system substrate-binding protein
VVTTTTQVTDFTKQIVGTAGTVTGLIQANQSAHSFDPSAAQLLALTKANAVVISGAGLEPWITDVLKASNFTGTVIDASTGISLIDGDPHIWTDPANAKKMVANIAAGLDVVSPANAATVNTNAAAYEAKLDALNAWAVASFAQVPAAKRLLVTNHDAFTYFVTAFGIDFVGSIIPGFDDNAEPSAARIDRVIRDIKASGATAIFSEASISPKLAQTIATEANVKVYSGDDALYSDSLGAPGSAGQNYISATVHNVTTLIQAWGYQPLPLPSELRS